MKPLSVWTLIHRKGCGGVAFYLEESIIAGARRPIVRAVLPDGRYPAPNEVMFCATCHNPLRKLDCAFANVEPMDAKRAH